MGDSPQRPGVILELPGPRGRCCESEYASQIISELSFDSAREIALDRVGDIPRSFHIHPFSPQMGRPNTQLVCICDELCFSKPLDLDVRPTKTVGSPLKP